MEKMPGSRRIALVPPVQQEVSYFRLPMMARTDTRQHLWISVVVLDLVVMAVMLLMLVGH